MSDSLPESRAYLQSRYIRPDHRMRANRGGPLPPPLRAGPTCRNLQMSESSLSLADQPVRPREIPSSAEAANPDDPYGRRTHTALALNPIEPQSNYRIDPFRYGSQRRLLAGDRSLQSDLARTLEQ